ncbi:MAG: S46 family peptidase [Acidobacteriia bacterium]|nr:S46 family peptidase [Terriglobia bacterium]
MKHGWLKWASFLCLAALAQAEEGKWTPQQVLQLILTNHHCLFGIRQEHSRPDRDLITNGFLARSREEELRGSTTWVAIPRKFTDVTKEVEAAGAAAGSGDLERAKAADAKQKALIADCEKTPEARCRVAAFDGGLQYVLVETMELTDVRLVYAPPRAVGDYGGETDNFRWPRHAGDFAIARAYKDGQPYRPEFYFPISQAGVKPGDFVMVLGYPGRTMRALTAEEMADQRDYLYKLREELYGQWIGILEKVDAEGAITVAATLKSLNNSHTNAQGQLAALARGRLIDKQKAADDRVMQWAAGRPAFAAAVEAKKNLEKLAAERRRTATRDYLFQAIQPGPLALKHATALVRLAAERAKPDAARDADYMEREWTRLRAAMERDQKSFYRPADEALFTCYVEHALNLGEEERIAAIDKVFQPDSIARTVHLLYEATRVTDGSERLKMFQESTEQLRARRDPMLDLAFLLEPELRAWQTAAKTHDGAVARLRPEWRRAVIAYAGKPVAPDANSTLRVSFAHVQGYAPRDAVFYTPQSTLAGMLEKNTGEEPFALPEKIVEAARGVDAAKIPIDFLANADTTGGNSGSPVVNGRGELVGANFDRVWENVANDFGYNPEIARNISVDVRFLLWLLKDVEKADGLLQELGVKR